MFLSEAAATFEHQLPHTATPYSSRAWGHGFHSLCSYQGKLKPALAHWLVRSFTSENDLVLDPLGGVGTVALEAALQGRTAFTNDLSPLASTVARAKIAPPDAARLNSEIEIFSNDLNLVELSELEKAAADFGLNAKVRDYYHPATLDEILKARRLMTSPSLSPERNFLKACLLHILHGNRPYALSRTSHSITPFNPTGPFEYRSVVERLKVRCDRLMRLEWPENYTRGQSWHADFRSLTNLLPAPVNAVISSPPFPGMRFDRSNWLRMWFCGWREEDFLQTSRNFLERQQGKDFAVYEEFFAICNETTLQGSPVILHVGGSKSYNMADQLTHIGSKYLRHVSTVHEDVSALGNHGIIDKGTTSSHIFLIFERV